MHSLFEETNPSFAFWGYTLEIPGFNFWLSGLGATTITIIHLSCASVRQAKLEENGENGGTVCFVLPPTDVTAQKFALWISNEENNWVCVGERVQGFNKIFCRGDNESRRKVATFSIVGTKVQVASPSTLSS